MPASICRQFLSLSLLALLSLSALPQTQGQDQDTVRIRTDLVVLDAQVTDKKTRAVVGGLTLQDFELFEDDVKQRIEHFSQDKLPLSMILLLDISPSVSPVMEQIAKGALQALQHLKPEDEVALMTFAGITETIQNFTKDRQLILDKINLALTKEGHGTRIHEAVGHAARHFKHHATIPDGRRVIVVITDNQGSMNRQDDAVSEAQIRDAVVESGATVSGVIVKSFLNVLDGILFQHPSMQEHFKRTTVNPYVELTGGEMTAANKETVNARLGEMINRLRSRYSLGYISTNRDFNGKFRHIRLSLTAEAKKRLSGEVAINSKQGYFATDREIEELLAESPPDSATPENPPPPPTNEAPPASKSGVSSPNPDPNVPVATRPDASDPGSATPSEAKPRSAPPPEKVNSVDDPLGDQPTRPYAHLVMLDVLATNKKTGAMIKNLGKDDFEIEANGVRQPIQHFSRGEMPLSLVLLVDVAGNTGYALSSLRRSARHWMSKLNPNDEIALMAFGGRAILVQDFTTDRRLIAGKLRNFAENARRQDVGAGQNRVGAVYQAAELMDQSANPLSRRMIVVVTDDGKSYEGGKPELVIERVIGAECSVFALVAKGSQPSQKGKVARSIIESAIYSFGNPVSFAINLGTRLATEAALNALLKDRNFGRLVSRSGGSAAQADGDETTDRLSMLLDYGRNRYVIGFAPQSNVSGKRYRELKLQLTPDARKRAGEVAFRAAEGYFAR